MKNKYTLIGMLYFGPFMGQKPDKSAVYGIYLGKDKRKRLIFYLPNNGGLSYLHKRYIKENEGKYFTRIFIDKNGNCDIIKKQTKYGISRLL